MSDKLKVCLLNDSFPPVIDGVANAVQNYAEILTAKDLAEVVVATPRYPDADYDAWPYTVIPYQSFDTTEIVKGYRAGNPLSIKLIDRIKDWNPDIIHCHCPVSSMVLARLLRAETGAPIVFTYHTKFDVDIKRAVKSKFIEEQAISFLVSNISAADEVWTVSEGAGQDLADIGYEGQYRVVGNGVDFPKGRVAADKVAEVIKGFDLPDGVPVFLFVGRIMDYKGLPIIAETMSALSRAGVDYRCVFVGGGADADKLHKRFEDAGIRMDVPAGDAEPDSDRAPEYITLNGDSTLPGRAIFTGPIYDREALKAWNTRADIFLFPSTYDTNGIVVREAAACGTASVLIRNSCAAEGITDGRNGFFIDENAESMTALLQELAAHPERMQAAGQRAMDEIYISWEDAVTGASALYQDLLSRCDDKETMIKKHHVFRGGLSLDIDLDADSLLDFSDVFDRGTDFLRDGTRKIIDKQKSMYYGMLSNVNELMDDAGSTMRELGNRLRDEFHDLSDRE